MITPKNHKFIGFIFIFGAMFLLGVDRYFLGQNGLISALSNSSSETVAVTFSSPAPTFEEIRDIFTDACSRCHGPGGRIAKNLDPELAKKMPDFSDPKWQDAKSDDHLIQVIKKGGAALGFNQTMPSWEHVLHERQIKGLVKLIRTFRDDKDT